MTETANSSYWQECVSNAAEECSAPITQEQISAIAYAVEIAHENYGMAFYTPPASDRLAVIESEAKAKLARLQDEFDAYRRGSERAIKRALNAYPDTQVTIATNGDVFRHGGRTEQIL